MGKKEASVFGIKGGVQPLTKEPGALAVPKQQPRNQRSTSAWSPGLRVFPNDPCLLPSNCSQGTPACLLHSRLYRCFACLHIQNCFADSTSHRTQGQKSTIVASRWIALDRALAHGNLRVLKRECGQLGGAVPRFWGGAGSGGEEEAGGVQPGSYNSQLFFI